MVIADFALVGAGLLLLLAGGEVLVRSAKAVAEIAGAPPFMVGALLVGFGTSVPELAVGIDAALVGSGDVAVGNVIGSNLCNGTLVLGLAALLNPLRIPVRLFRVDIPVLIAVSGAVVFFLQDSTLQRGEALLLLVALAAYLAATVRSVPRDPAARDLAESTAEGSWAGLLTSCLVGIAGLVVGAQWLVEGATLVARDLDVSEATIAISLVAFGTSLPEVATTVVAARHRANDLAVGNLVGSNLFNVMAVLGLSGLTAPLRTVDVRGWELAVFVGAPVVLILFAARGHLGRCGAIGLVLGYGGIIAALAREL